MARLFVALLLPDDIKKELIQAQKTIRRLKQVDGTFIRAENLHITLNFLGHIKEEEIPQIITSLSAIKTQPFLLALDSIGKFPKDSSRIRIIWASIRGDLIYALAQSIACTLSYIKPEEQRHFDAHLTLVRVKKISHLKHFIESLNNIKLEPLSFMVNEFVLMESRLSHEGATYFPLARFILA